MGSKCHNPKVSDKRVTSKKLHNLKYYVKHPFFSVQPSIADQSSELAPVYLSPLRALWSVANWPSPQLCKKYTNPFQVLKNALKGIMFNYFLKLRR